jgi:hypothetical protein
MRATTEPIYRWRVSAKSTGSDHRGARLALLRRAGRVPDLETGPAVYGEEPFGPTTDFRWLFSTKHGADAFAASLKDVESVTITSESAGDRLLREVEGRATKEDHLAGRLVCINCGDPINPRDPQIAVVAFMLDRGSGVSYTCDCGFKNEIEIVAAPQT